MDLEEIVIRLDARVIRRAQQLAAESGIAIGELVSREIERLWAEHYRSVRDEALKELQTGFDLGGGPLPNRDSLYDR